MLKLIAFAPAPLVARGWPAAPQTPQARTYYVSPSGDDNATGLSQSTPWRTISGLNAKMADGSVKAGDTVLLQAGQTFFGKIRPPNGTAPDAVVLTIGSYASGQQTARPIVSSYKVLTVPSGWQRVDGTTWSISVSNANAGVTHHGYDGKQGGGANIGFLKVDGQIHGRRCFALGDLAEDWDFYCANDVLYVRATANPTTLATDLRASCDGACVQLRNALRITHLRLEGSGGHGMQGTAVNVRADDNEFAELGGSVLKDTTRYGNGFEAWIDSADVVVERNIFHDIYDTAFTAQGGPQSTTGSWSNISLRNNLIYLCNQSIEFWSAGAGPGFVNCLVECNTCLYSGYGWSAHVRPDLNTRVHLLTYGWDLPADITVRRNTFYDGKVAYRYSATRTTPGLVCSANLICQRAGGLLRYGQPQTVEQWQAWTAAEQNDTDSTFWVLPDDAAIDVAAAWNQVVGKRSGCTPPAPPLAATSPK